MKTKKKLYEALEKITQLRVELMFTGNKSAKKKLSEIEMTIFKGIDLLNNVALADVRHRSFVNLYKDGEGSFIGEGRYKNFVDAFDNRDDVNTYKNTVEIIWYGA